jgi:plastocyanin
MRTSFIAALLASAAAVSAQQTFNVLVGANDTLTFQPDTVNASVGDTIAFTFLSKNHTVTQSTFAAPCTNFSADGIDSGFVPVDPTATSFQQYSFTMNNVSAPLWFYCRQTGHCGKGMVFAVNPTAAKSFSAFQAAAMATSGNSTSGSPSGYPSGSGSGSGSAGSPTASSPAAGSATASSGAVKLSGGAAGLLSFVGLAAGMLL